MIRLEYTNPRPFAYTVRTGPGGHRGIVHASDRSDALHQARQLWGPGEYILMRCPAQDWTAKITTP